MDDKKLYLIIERQLVCKECGQPLEENFCRYHAYLIIMNSAHPSGRIIPGRIVPGCHFLSVEGAKDWANEVAKELGQPITETEMQ